MQGKSEKAAQGRVVGGIDHELSMLRTGDNDTKRSRLLKSVEERLENLPLAMKETKEKAKKFAEKKKKKKNNTVTHEQRNNEHSVTADVPIKNPPLRSSTVHPGLDAFHIWYSAISDIYRMYSIGKIDEEAPLPVIPRSENGRVRVAICVNNRMLDDIDVYWVDYKGRDTFKGSIRFNSNKFCVSTWVGHPWTFRRRRDHQLLLHFVPFRVLPIAFGEAKKIEDKGKDRFIGHYEFTIVEPDLIDGNEACSVIDNILPYPPESIRSINHAMEISCQQMEREGTNPQILLKYLYKIVSNPSESKFRQIRTSNKIFWNNVWISGGRGILNALGFQECGAFIEMGPDAGPLPSDRLKNVCNAIIMLEELSSDMEDPNRKGYVRPPGTNNGDLVGRAGWS